MATAGKMTTALMLIAAITCSQFAMATPMGNGGGGNGGGGGNQVTPPPCNVRGCHASTLS